MREVVIVSAVRTALGAFNGVYKNTTAVELGATVVKEAVKRAGLQPNQIDEVIFGNVLSAGLGQNVARQVSVHAGLPIEVPSFAINKVCGSGLKSITLAAQAIMAGDADVIVAGGTENMSRSPYVLNNHRVGNKMGNVEMVDTMLRDGLTDAFEGYHMGVTAENIVEKYGFTREQQDTLALNSQLRAEAAVTSGRFKDEIVPVEIKGRKGDITVVDTDEYPKFGTTLETLGKLRPAFKKDGGSVTAGNASGINDGAAAIILMSAEKAAELGIKPLAKFVVGTSSGVAPEIMGTGPISSSQKALERAGWTVDDLDLVEANEAFAAQALSVITDLKLDTEKVNVNGGAIALGHPVGASGARIFVTLIHEMLKRDSKKGMATLCIGGGQGVTVLIER